MMEPLKDIMKCGILSNDNGELLIIHDQPFTSKVEWIEYNTQEENLSLILENGHVQDLGIELSQKTCSNVSNGTNVNLAYINDAKLQDVLNVSIVIQDY